MADPRLVSAAPGPGLPTILLLCSATLWGLSWWPLRWFAAQGLSGAALSLLSYGPVGLAGLYVVLRERAHWRGSASQLFWLGLVGGWGNVAFVSALMLGDVVRVMLLFYLAPVWSVLGGRLFLHERVGPRRLVAVALALTGLWLVIGGAAAFTSPLSAADLLALSAGLAFAGNNLMSRATPHLPMRSKTVAVFMGGALTALPIVLWQGQALPVLSLPLSGLLLLYGFGWLLLAMALWQYGVTHLETGRAGVILVMELVVAVLTVTLFGGETLLPLMWFGGLLITAASLLEATDPGLAAHALAPAPDHPNSPSFSRSPHEHRLDEPAVLD
jgi:drug/metabolite transporter (DMT)-like permease